MIQRLRLFSGLVMLAYVTMHLLNHAVGLISLEAMENVLWYIFRIWTNRPAQLVLYSSFLGFCQRLRQLADTSRDGVRSWLF